MPPTFTPKSGSRPSGPLPVAKKSAPTLFAFGKIELISTAGMVSMTYSTDVMNSNLDDVSYFLFVCLYLIEGKVKWVSQIVDSLSDQNKLTCLVKSQSCCL
jgi:hypothetical protein